MKTLLVLLIGTLPAGLRANQPLFLAIINDPDGFTCIRSDKGKEFPAIDTVRKEAFFYCYGDTTASWINVQNPIGSNGYMHKSRIMFFSALDSAKQYRLILNGFNAIIRCEKAYWKNSGKRTKEESLRLNRERNEIYDGKFVPAYSAMEELFCKKADSVLFCAFIKTLPYVSGSADEELYCVPAKCWLCNQDFVNNLLCHLPDKKERDSVRKHIKTGLQMSGMDANYKPEELKKMYAKLDWNCN